MSCNSAEALFDRFLDGALAGAQHERLVTHVDRCSDCRGMLEELRTIETLLVAPRRIELAPNFTFATMAEVRTLRPPLHHRAPLRAYLVSYVVAAWLIAGAASLLAPQTMHAIVGTTLDIARNIADAIGGLGAVIGRLFGRGGSVLGAMLGALLALDAILVAGFGLALRYVRPRLVERLRS
jgi:predicted anti-sigma-YlaC factor YlaD